MLRRRIIALGLASIVQLASSSAATAKRIIYVADDKACSWGEGHYRKQSVGTDVFVREAEGKDLSDAWSQLEEGDELIIITHGNKGTIKLRGVSYAGFKKDGATGGGTGASCRPYVLPETDLDEITVTLKVCHSASDPDGDGPKISVEESMEPLLTGDDSTVTGKDDELNSTYCPHWENGTEAQQKNALRCLSDKAEEGGYTGRKRVNDWLEDLTYEEHKTVQGVIEDCKDQGADVDDVEIVFEYPEPRFGDPRRWVGPPPTMGDDRDEIDDLECRWEAPCDSYCGWTPLATVSEWGLIVMTLLLLTAGAIALGRRRRPVVARD